MTRSVKGPTGKIRRSSRAGSGLLFSSSNPLSKSGHVTNSGIPEELSSTEQEAIKQINIHGLEDSFDLI